MPPSLLDGSLSMLHISHAALLNAAHQPCRTSSMLPISHAALPQCCPSAMPHFLNAPPNPVTHPTGQPTKDLSRPSADNRLSFSTLPFVTVPGRLP